MIKKKQILFLTVVFAILVLQIYKKIGAEKEKALIEQSKKEANSEFVKLLDQLPVYRDSIFKIYIANFSGKTKIVYLKKDSLTDILKKSKVFLHLYPRDKKNLKEGNTNVALDFKKEYASFVYRNSKYFILEKELPNFIIDKINTGMYAYNLDNSVSWEIKNILRNEEIKKILSENRESVLQFED